MTLRLTGTGIIKALLLGVAPLLLAYTTSIEKISVYTYNYDIIALTNGKIIIALLLILMLSAIIFSRRRACKETKLLNYLLFLSLIFSLIFGSNYPVVIHRDAYLHGGPVYYMLSHGTFNGLEEYGRDDAIYWPIWFILLATYTLITNNYVIDAITLLSIVFPLILALFLYSFLIKKLSLNRKPALYSLMILPFLVNHYGFITSIFSRFHLAILYSIMLTYIFATLTILVKERYDIKNIILTIIIAASLILCHPYVSTFTVVSIVMFTLLSLFRHGEIRAKRFSFAVPMAVFYVSHLVYYSAKYFSLGIDAISKYIYNPRTLEEFATQSTPITTIYPSGLGVLFQAIRFMYRFFLLSSLISLGLVFLYILARERGKSLDSVSYWIISSAISIVVTGFYLISSQLWWERTIYLLAFTVFWFLLKTSQSLERNIIGKKYVMTILSLITLVGVLISPVIAFDTNYSTTRIRYYSVDLALTMISASQAQNVAMCGGTYTSIYYTFFAIKSSVSPMVVFKNGSSQACSYIVFSIIDPEVVKNIVDLKTFDTFYDHIFSSNIVNMWKAP